MSNKIQSHTHNIDHLVQRVQFCNKRKVKYPPNKNMFQFHIFYHNDNFIPCLFFSRSFMNLIKRTSKKKGVQVETFYRN